MPFLDRRCSDRNFGGWILRRTPTVFHRPRQRFNRAIQSVAFCDKQGEDLLCWHTTRIIAIVFRERQSDPNRRESGYGTPNRDRRDAEGSSAWGEQPTLGCLVFAALRPGSQRMSVVQPLERAYGLNSSFVLAFARSLAIAHRPNRVNNPALQVHQRPRL